MMTVMLVGYLHQSPEGQRAASQAQGSVHRLDVGPGGSAPRRSGGAGRVTRTGRAEAFVRQHNYMAANELILNSPKQPRNRQ